MIALWSGTMCYNVQQVARQLLRLPHLATLSNMLQCTTGRAPVTQVPSPLRSLEDPPQESTRTDSGSISSHTAHGASPADDGICVTATAPHHARPAETHVTYGHIGASFVDSRINSPNRMEEKYNTSPTEAAMGQHETCIVTNSSYLVFTSLEPKDLQQKTRHWSKLSVMSSYQKMGYLGLLPTHNKLNFP
ncbi:hypothetical protein QAD02_007686 [Eretmocerus hayati]|uniref:Uncharacterized protein n=1 Tax=Eretmocerus hayati TaxID=131215 RepID=A0ACC2N493_9HYME|nr:hypothetical protein QAD02_007686 [Eretmocerus hayati]